MAYTPLEAAQVIMQALCRKLSCWKNGHWESLGDKAHTEECNNHCVLVSMCFSAISLDHLDLEDEDPDFEDLVQTSVLSEIIGKVWKVIV